MTYSVYIKWHQHWPHCDLYLDLWPLENLHNDDDHMINTKFSYIAINISVYLSLWNDATDPDLGHVAIDNPAGTWCFRPWFLAFSEFTIKNQVETALSKECVKSPYFKWQNRSATAVSVFRKIIMIWKMWYYICPWDFILDKNRDIKFDI